MDGKGLTFICLLISNPGRASVNNYIKFLVSMVYLSLGTSDCTCAHIVTVSVLLA